MEKGGKSYPSIAAKEWVIWKRKKGGGERGEKKKEGENPTLAAKEG
jgi:hypothetical protein